ncbi:hydroxyacylglutathione hydrolase [secondary endosymbiont of Heteropsylla cubana]|uniref:Hydroxyacylglutathione hydrolase n=1 Tax=secondary endosymbiont of Heteropsylla cubana TaxID=134287 RepID=J3YT63_9ENTR|nr:hydroxyacylglutathione hydrolase [secondary endosymbiont of Heteropsylla cubana]AFP85618.1 hydroxyacylglutathione hydrolase [secondary endosymbiont of Heteropsylla cubana]
MNSISIPALKDNYIWFLKHHNNNYLLIDPGDALPILHLIEDYKLLPPIAILLTHHHQDHVGGVSKLLEYYCVPVYGPKETHDNGATKIVKEGDTIKLLEQTFYVIGLPGHTLGHIGFYSAPWLFCGDTVFSAGCGRLLEDTSQQMYKSFQKINQLPSNTLIYPAHEYTVSNLNFASALLPHDHLISSYHKISKKLEQTKQPTLPTTLYLERKINPFFRCHDIYVQKALDVFPLPGEEWRVFSALRKKKDYF